MSDEYTPRWIIEDQEKDAKFMSWWERIGNQLTDLLPDICSSCGKGTAKAYDSDGNQLCEECYEWKNGISLDEAKGAAGYVG